MSLVPAYTAVAGSANNRVVRPGYEFCSWITVGIFHPIEGPILESLSDNEHVDLSNADCVSVCLEADSLVLLAGPISYNEGPWTSETARERVGSVMVAIEIADDRLSKKSNL